MKLATEVKTVEEMIEQWDGGGSFFTIECGGLGPGYEQAIQVAAVEFARAQIEKPITLTTDEKDLWNRWDKKCSELLFGELGNKLGGLSGAQFGAAKWLSWQWCFKGGPGALEQRARADGKEDRIIQVSRHFPEAPMHGVQTKAQ